MPQFITIRRFLVSDLVSNWLGGTSAIGVYLGIVHKPDLRLGFENSKRLRVEAVAKLDGFY